MFPETIKILVVDDMPAIRDLVKSQLRVLNYRNVIEASEGEAAFNIVSKAMESGAPVDLIISDWNMPKMTGLEFLKQVRASAQLAKTPFLLLTSESEREQVTEAILAGVSQYIVKPFAAKSFEDKLRTVWNKINQGA
jgi:two-component system, chemotaxis family, chemotaxis protein CheY